MQMGSKNYVVITFGSYVRITLQKHVRIASESYVRLALGSYVKKPCKKSRINYVTKILLELRNEVTLDLR